MNSPHERTVAGVLLSALAAAKPSPNRWVSVHWRSLGNVIANLICGCISCDDTNPYRDEALPADDEKWNIGVLVGSEMRSKKQPTPVSTLALTLPDAIHLTWHSYQRIHLDHQWQSISGPGTSGPMGTNSYLVIITWQVRVISLREIGSLRFA